MQKIAILYDASHAVLSTFDLDEVLNQILTIVRDYFHLRSGAILLLNRAAKTLTVRAEFSPHFQQKNQSIPLGKGITGSAAKLKRPIYAADVRKEARYIEGDPDTKSELAIPLIVQDEVVGVLDCQSDQVNAFDNETVDLLTLFATNAAIALQNSELYNRERRRATQLETIYKVARQTTAVLDLNELLGTMCSLLPDAFGADHVSVFLLDPDQKLILRREQGKLICRVREGEPLPTQPGYSESVLSLGQGILANDMTPDLGACENTGSEMCVPLISFGQRIGLVICSSAKKDAYHPDDLKSLESMADILATAIQNAGYVEQVRMQANLDGLTGIFNRRYFEMKILEKMSEASRYGGNMALLMLDIDHFKAINDEFGHLLGDEVLKQVSGLLSHNLRKVDLLCRYGGEEYAIIAPATDGEHARSFADKLRKMIEQFQFPGVPRSV
ncbi:MAG TPA: sensor domain-containing diguanylate cyclase, partial [Terriglobales bacterium]